MGGTRAYEIKESVLESFVTGLVTVYLGPIYTIKFDINYKGLVQMVEYGIIILVSMSVSMSHLLDLWYSLPCAW